MNCPEQSGELRTSALENRSGISSYMIRERRRPTRKPRKQWTELKQRVEHVFKGWGHFRGDEGSMNTNHHKGTNGFACFTRIMTNLARLIRTRVSWAGFKSVHWCEGQTAQTCLVSQMVPLWSQVIDTNSLRAVFVTSSKTFYMRAAGPFCSFVSV